MPLWSKARVFPANRDMGATTHLGVESARMAACLQSFCMHSVEPSVRVSCCSAISARCGSGRPLRAASLRVFSRTRAPALLGLVLLRATSTPSEVGRHERNVVLVTGASRGLGMFTLLLIVVISACRSRAPCCCHTSYSHTKQAWRSHEASASSGMLWS